MKIRDALMTKDLKYRVVVTIGPNEPVSAAIKKLAEHDRGALSVCDDKGNLVGIITERDILRKCFTESGEFINKKIADTMSSKVVIATPVDEVDYAINVMKKERIRHIPVVDEQKILGMISMRDLLGLQYEETKAEIRYAYMIRRR